jgi:hypothetical protein
MPFEDYPAMGCRESGEGGDFFAGSSAEFVQVIRFRKISKVMQQSEFRDA